MKSVPQELGPTKPTDRRLDAIAFEAALRDLAHKLPWGSSGLDHILGHIRVTEDELAACREENERLTVALAQAGATPFDQDEALTG